MKPFIVLIVLASIGMGIALYYRYYKKSLPKPFTSRTIQSGTITLYTESFGSPTNPAILLISGAMAPARFWTDDFCQQLATANYFARQETFVTHRLRPTPLQ